MSGPVPGLEPAPAPEGATGTDGGALRLLSDNYAIGIPAAMVAVGAVATGFYFLKQCCKNKKRGNGVPAVLGSACPFPNFETSDSSNVDHVPQTYLDWANQKVSEARTHDASHLYQQLCAYVLSNEDIRERTQFKNTHLIIAFKYDKDNNFVVYKGLVSDLYKHSNQILYGPTCWPYAWLAALGDVAYITVAPDNNVASITPSVQTVQLNTKPLSKNVLQGTNWFLKSKDQVKHTICTDIGVVDVLTKQAIWKFVFPANVQVQRQQFDLEDIAIPPNLSCISWMRTKYFTNSDAYKRFVPPYEVAERYINEVATIASIQEEAKTTWLNTLLDLYRFIAIEPQHGQDVWAVRNHEHMFVERKQRMLESQNHQGQPGPQPNVCTAQVSDQEARVIVSDKTIIVPNVVYGIVYGRQHESQESQKRLLLAQTLLLRVLYCLNTIIYEDSLTHEGLQKLVNLDNVANSITIDMQEKLSNPPQVPKSEIVKLTNLKRNVPRISVDQDVFIVPTTNTIRPTSYKNHLERFVPLLLVVRSIDELKSVITQIVDPHKGALNIIARENSKKIDTTTVSNVKNDLEALCLQLWKGEEAPNTPLGMLNVAAFGQLASKFTSTDQLRGTCVDFALRVLVGCCKGLGLSLVANEGVYTLSVKRYSETQMYGFGGLLSKRQGNTPHRTDLFNQNQEHDHKAYQTAANALYSQSSTSPFTTYGYVLRVVRWLMSVVAGIGQFDENDYVKLSIEDTSANDVSITFAKRPREECDVGDSTKSCKEHRTWFRTEYETATTNYLDVVSIPDMADLPFVMEYLPQGGKTHGCSIYYVCKYNMPLQMTPSFKAEQKKPWLDKIGFLDVVMYRLSEIGSNNTQQQEQQQQQQEQATSQGLGVTPFVYKVRDLVVNQDNIELKACYQMMDIPSFSSNFEALPIVEAYYDTINKQQTQKASDMFKDAAANLKNTVTQVKESLRGKQVDSSNKEKYKIRFVQHILLWMLSGNYALPKVDHNEYVEKAARARTQLQGGAVLDATRNIEDVVETTFTRYNVKHVDKINDPNFDLYYIRMAKPRFTNLLGLLLGRMNFEPKVAIHVLDMYWNYTPTNGENTQAYVQKVKNATFEYDVSTVRQDLGLWWTLPAPPRQPKQATGQAAQQVNQASSKDLQVQENAWLTENNVPNTVKSRKTWQTIINYGFEGLYREVASDPNVDATQRDTLLRNIRNAADNSKPFAYNKNSPSGWDYYFSNLGQRLYVYNDTWTDLRYHKRAQEHAAKRGNQVAQNPNYQQVNQGGIGALPGVGLALGGAAMQHAQSAFRGSTNIFGDQRAQQQQPKGQVTFNHHTTTGQTVTAKVNTASELQDDADKRIQRVYADKLSTRARNLTFTDAQGRSVFTLLPHNILAIVLLLVYAILVLYASSIGTSTYTLLNVDNTQASSYAANLPDLQKPRMACSTFFGIGVGMLVAFVVSLVEIVNNTRLRQALFIVLMAAPIIVLGAMGVAGASDVCGVNTMTSGESTTSTWSTDQAAQSPVRPVKRKRGTIEQKTPRVAKFFKSLLGTHDSDVDGTAMLGGPPSCTQGGASPVCSNDMKTQCSTTKPCASGVCLTGTCNNDPSAPCATDMDCIDDVTRNNMKASDFLFIGIGIGVLLAGFCTLIPGNPFHPDVHDTMHGLLKQKDFSVSSQIKRHWLIYFGLFSLVLLGGASSSLWLGLATPAVAPKDAKKGETIQGPANTQAGVMIAVSVVLFFAIMAGGMLHRKSHSKLANEVISSGILQGQATSSKVELGQPR